MANLKSSKKDIRRTVKRRRANASQKSKVRTFLKKAKVASCNAKTYQEGMKAIVDYEKNAMISTKNHLFSKKFVARSVSSLVLRLKSRFQKNEQVFNINK
jgi:small subunit ribosomal protein S20